MSAMASGMEGSPCADFRADPSVRTAVPRTDEDLLGLLETRRRACTEFAPAHTVPNAGASEQSGAQMTQCKSAPAPGAPAALSQTEGRHLGELMRRRRESCVEFESSPEICFADVASTPSTASKPAHVATRSSTLNSDMDLYALLAKMKGRCQVLESTPMPGCADASITSCAPAAIAIDLESTPSVCSADARWQPHSASSRVVHRLPATAGDSVGACRQQIGAAQHGGATAPVDVAHGPESLRARVRNGHPLSRSLRPHVWAECLPKLNKQVPVCRGTSASCQDTDAAACTPLLTAVLSVLAGSTVEDAQSHQRLCSDVDAGGYSLRALAESFAERYLSWLGNDNSLAGDCDRGGIPQVFVMLARLMRYHCPEAAAAIEARQDRPDAAAFLHNIFDGAGGLLNHLFCVGRQGTSSEALLLACDCSVLEDRDLLLLFVALVVLVEAITSESVGCNPEQLVEALSNFAAQELASAARSLEKAVAFYDATPLSTLTRGMRSSAEAHHLPMCAVSPDEVLTHIYERPASTWRLVVVDVRRDAHAAFALPLCVRIGPRQDRVSVLQDVPYEESIHLCLLADGPPACGDAAFDLCRYITGEPAMRRHVSVAEGGWAAVEELASNLGLELMRVEPDSAFDGETGGVSSSASDGTAHGSFRAAARGLLQGAGRALFGSMGFGSDAADTATVSAECT